MKQAKSTEKEEGERNSLAKIQKIYSYASSFWEEGSNFCWLCHAHDEIVSQQRHLCSAQGDCIKMAQEWCLEGFIDWQF